MNRYDVYIGYNGDGDIGDIYIYMILYIHYIYIYDYIYTHFIIFIRIYVYIYDSCMYTYPPGIQHLCQHGSHLAI